MPPKRKVPKKKITNKSGKMIQNVNVYTGRRSAPRKSVSSKPISSTDMLLTSLLRQNQQPMHTSNVYLPADGITSKLPKTSEFGISTATLGKSEATLGTQTEKPVMKSFETQTNNEPVKEGWGEPGEDPNKEYIITPVEPYEKYSKSQLVKMYVKRIGGEDISPSQLTNIKQRSKEQLWNNIKSVKK